MSSPSASVKRKGFAGNIGEYRGFEEFDELVKQRVYSPHRSTSLATVLGSSDLAKLLGSYESNGTTTTFQNGAPNSANVVMYSLALRKLAQEITDLLSARGNLNNEFKDAFYPLFQTRNDSTFESAWIALMGYEAPFEELEAWKAFLNSPAMVNRTPTEFVRESIFTILFNPHFLLRK